tara:strand:+ start:332 stop:1006 length:675 start_codon:yes stop_codon:yes gene_type:complete
MLLSKDKKIFIYLFLLIFLGSINNKNFIDNRIFEIKNLKVQGLNQNEKIKLLIQLEQIKNQNIFFLPKKKIIEIFNSENLIESFLINKNYPSNLNIVVKKTSFLANMNVEDENFLVGSNKKLIKSEYIDPNLPIVFGTPPLNEFFLIKNNILNSSIKLNDVKKFYFFPSKRWDIELINGVLIKLPSVKSIEALNNYFDVKNLSQFDNVKIFDMRIDKQIIINEL